MEKHGDFLRDFRGDTVHPSTLRIMDELGLIDEFLRLPHTKINYVAFDTNGRIRTFGNFGALKWLGLRRPYVALMPQWDFLDFLAEKASTYQEFTLVRNAEVEELIFDSDRVAGVRTPELEVRADLVIGADGRRSEAQGVLLRAPTTCARTASAGRSPGRAATSRHPEWRERRVSSRRAGAGQVAWSCPDSWPRERR